MEFLKKNKFWIASFLLVAAMVVSLGLQADQSVQVQDAVS